MIIGLTGGSGSGKGCVSRVFEANGFEVIDFDEVSRQVSARGSECLREITDFFGSDILNEDMSLNRRALGRIVFADTEKLDILNKITHKHILTRTEQILKGSSAKNFVFDAPLLFEAGLDKMCDFVISVIAEREKRIQRICLRDLLDSQTAQNRIDSQHDDDFYIAKSDFVIYNNNSTQYLKEETLRVIEKICSVS